LWTTLVSQYFHEAAEAGSTATPIAQSRLTSAALAPGASLT